MPSLVNKSVIYNTPETFIFSIMALSLSFYLMKDGQICDAVSHKDRALGVIFDETNEQIRFLPVFDIACYQSYSLQEIIDIAEAYDQKHGNRYLHWSFPSLTNWKLIISRLGETQVLHGEELCFNDRMEEWEEFDSAIAIENLKKFGLSPELTYWTCSQGYDDEMFLLDLESGTIEAYPVGMMGRNTIMPYDFMDVIIVEEMFNKHEDKGC